MTHLHSHSDVLPASNFEQPKVSFPRGPQIVRRPVKALLGVVLIGSAVGIGVLIAGRSAVPGIDQNAPVSPATVPSSSVATELYQPGALAGHAPVEEWRAAEAGAFGETYQYQPGPIAGYAPLEVWSQAERGIDSTTLASAATAQHPETLSAEEGRLIGLAAVDAIQRQALQAAGCAAEESECPPIGGYAAAHDGLSYAEDIQWKALQAAGCGPEDPSCNPTAGSAAAHSQRSYTDDVQWGALQAAGCGPEAPDCPALPSGDQDGAELGNARDGFGEHADESVTPSTPFGPI